MSQDEAFFEVIAVAIAEKNNEVLTQKIIWEMFMLFFTRYLEANIINSLL